MSSVILLNEGQIEALAKVLSVAGTGTDIDRALEHLGLNDNSGENTKWRRLYRVFLDIQGQDKCAKDVLAFIQHYLTPARFVWHREAYEKHRDEINFVLAFSGLEFGQDGEFAPREVAQTTDEAEHRAQTLRGKFHHRRLHSEVLKYCRTELMQDNYFHAVFEASKGLAQRIRALSGASGDGVTLVDRVFLVSKPLLKFNNMRTETEKSEHRGFAALLKGCFAAIRNPLAHEPKILWEGEDDAADYLSLISLLHRKLDDCVRTGMREPG